MITEIRLYTPYVEELSEGKEQFLQEIRAANGGYVSVSSWINTESDDYHVLMFYIDSDTSKAEVALAIRAAIEDPRRTQLVFKLFVDGQPDDEMLDLYDALSRFVSASLMFGDSKSAVAFYERRKRRGFM